ncbi:MAG TPA: SH3 domain-containing protein [Acidobacteriaceae bacterium]|nr:SH3 domain-containing protein [Acidobacteriaceae bacterium]
MQPRSLLLFDRETESSGRYFRASAWPGTLLLGGTLLLSGCGRLEKVVVPQQVYVTAKQAYLRDRVAAVSNRTGEVQNGDKLTVLGHQRRFLQVKAPNGAVGWIEEKLTADQGIADQFGALKTQHEKDPVVAQAVTRDEVYLHVAPGRDTIHFFRLSENEPLSLLERASVAKPLPPGSNAASLARPSAGKLPVRASGSAARKVETDTPEQPAGPPEPVMEDWWLVRTKSGDTGWIYGRMIDVTVPDTLARYAEGQRIVGAYVLTNAEDPESNIVNNGQPVTSIPEYVTVLSPYKAGLPYDFNQVRVFIWNVKKHRYETAYREHNIAGFLPVQIGLKKDPYNKDPHFDGALPSFTVKVLPADAPLPVPDPQTGLVKPARVMNDTLRLEGNIMKRVWPPNAAPPQFAHPDPEPEKGTKGKKRR